MYSEYQPNLLLSPYVDKYWEFKGNLKYGTRINILPDGCTDFIFNLGEIANAVGENLSIQPYRSYFVGPMSKYSELVTYTNAIHSFGIRFLPGGIFRFINLPLPELSNQRIDTNYLPSLFGDSFAERLYEQTDLPERICLIEKILIKALYTLDLSDQQINYAIHQINLYQGKLSIRTLMEKICLCQRHFERKFRQFTGYTPKEYSRIMKFRHAIELLKQANANTLLSIAIDAGYYDSAHFAKEIKTLSGKTASTFLSLDIPEDVTLTYL